MATARPSFTKRQRETAKRERKELKAAKRAARKEAGRNETPDEEIVSADEAVESDTSV